MNEPSTCDRAEISQHEARGKSLHESVGIPRTSVFANLAKKQLDQGGLLWRWFETD